MLANTRTQSSMHGHRVAARRTLETRPAMRMATKSRMQLVVADKPKATAMEGRRQTLRWEASVLVGTFLASLNILGVDHGVALHAYKRVDGHDVEDEKLTLGCCTCQKARWLYRIDQAFEVRVH